MDRDRLALFLMLGQTAEKIAASHPDAVPPESLPISTNEDLALLLPGEVRESSKAAEVYRLFFVFERYLRDLVLDVLSETDAENWWSKVPADVQKDVADEEERDETKRWMGIGARDKLSLTTLPQLIKIIDDKELWRDHFQPVLFDKALVQEARHIAHLRNVICHMNVVPPDEVARVKQVIRDWFRVAAP